MQMLGLVLSCVRGLCDLMDCSPPGSSVHGILQARIQEWAAMSSQPRDQTWVSCIIGRFFIHYVNSSLQMVKSSFMF